MATKKMKKASKATPRVGTKPAPKNPRNALVDDGLSRAEIDRANAAGPGAVATLIRAATKSGKAKTPAKGKTSSPTPTPAAPAKGETPRPRDPRLPKAGTVLTRTFGKKEIKVTVLDRGFEFDGKTWRSLSAIAKAVTGTSWNGFLAFGLMTRTAKPTATPTETK